MVLGVVIQPMYIVCIEPGFCMLDVKASLKFLMAALLTKVDAPERVVKFVDCCSREEYILVLGTHVFQDLCHAFSRGAVLQIEDEAENIVPDHILPLLWIVPCLDERIAVIAPYKLILVEGGHSRAKMTDLGSQRVDILHIPQDRWTLSIESFMRQGQGVVRPLFFRDKESAKPFFPILR